MRVGVLSLQGASEPHREMLRSLGVEATLVRDAAQIETLTHLVMPGGESTTIRHLLDLFSMVEPIVRRARSGELAILGTCAGAILLGRDDDMPPPRLNLLDVAFDRNAYGTQVESFAQSIELGLTAEPFRAIFIRAPRIREVGPGVEVLAKNREGEPVLVASGKLMAATFHPELSGDSRVHRTFLARAAAAPVTARP